MASLYFVIEWALFLLLYNLGFVSFIFVEKNHRCKILVAEETFTSAAQFKQYNCIIRSCMLLKQGWLPGHMTCAQTVQCLVQCASVALSKSLIIFFLNLGFCLWSLIGPMIIGMHEQRRSVQCECPPLLATPVT